jgi:hypothetical protein
MRIREYMPADLDALRQMHAAQGFGYPLPNLDSPMFVSKLVLEEDDSPENDATQGRELPSASSLPNLAIRGSSSPAASPRITMAILLRLTAEAYLLHDPASGTPRQRWQRLLALHEAGRRDAAARGLDDVQAFLPPRIARSFGRRLAQLGWTRDPWPCFSRHIP